MKRRSSILLAVLIALLAGLAATAQAEQAGTFSFAVVADVRRFAGPGHHTPSYFLGALEAIRDTGPVAFLIVPGDIDPPENVMGEITTTLGAAVPAYVAIGNHDTENAAYMGYIRSLNAGGATLPHVVRKGPPGSQETMYAFEWADAHVAVLNEYFDGASDTGERGDVTDATFAWLSEDLASVTKPLVFVVGHNPAHVFPDMTSGRVRHEGGGLEANPVHRDRFWKLLQDRHVTAYICGHTHNASARNISGVWQLDAGHARGKGDKGAPSTFIRVTVGEGRAAYEYYRADAQGLNYKLTASGSLVKE